MYPKRKETIERECVQEFTKILEENGKMDVD